MGMLHEIRHRGRHIVGPFFGVCLLVYFVYHAVQGERGLIAWARVSKDIESTQAALLASRAQEHGLEARVRLLRPDSLDRDMLDEQARRMLNVIRPGEKVILLPSDPLD
jgi:cell division protein FtsB